MKKFLLLITCLIMFCIGTVQANQHKEAEQPKTESYCFDTGTSDNVIVQADFNYNTYVVESGFASYVISKTDTKESVSKYKLQKDALCSRYSSITDCPVTYIRKCDKQYATHYTYKLSNPYNRTSVLKQ